MKTFVVSTSVRVGAKKAARRTSVLTAKPAPKRMSAADECKLNAMIAQHQKVRSQLSTKYRNELDQLTVQMRKQLFAALPRVNLLASCFHAGAFRLAKDLSGRQKSQDNWPRVEAVKYCSVWSNSSTKDQRYSLLRRSRMFIASAFVYSPVVDANLILVAVP